MSVTGWWFSVRTTISSTNKSDHNNITEILLKVALKTVTLTSFRICTFPTDCKIMFYRSSLPIRHDKGSPFMQSSMKITHFPPKSVHNFNVVATCEFSISYELSSDFFYNQLSTNYEKIKSNTQIRWPFHCSC